MKTAHNNWTPAVLITATVKSQSQGQSYFMTGGLLSISSSWQRVPQDSRPVILFSNWTLAVMALINILSDERMGLSFTIPAGPCQRSHSQVRIPRDLWPHFTVSDSRLPQPGRPGPHIYIPQELGGPVITPGNGFAFHCLLWLAGLWWTYLTPPPHSINCNS
jgi:hypothetical protein